MNTMTLDDVIKDAKSRDAILEPDMNLFSIGSELIVIRQSDAPSGIAKRGVVNFGGKIFKVDAVQHKKFSDLDTREVFGISMRRFRNWMDIFNHMCDRYSHFSETEIVALIWVGDEIVL